MLFDKHDRPVLRDMTAEAAWKACDEFEDHAYNVADSLSEDEWDHMISDVRALRAEYYTLFDSMNWGG
jgi:hypothetical protein